jgi:hypothetical protein
MVLRTMRAPDGGPALRTRALALLVVLGMLGLAAPPLITVTRWLLSGAL